MMNKQSFYRLCLMTIAFALAVAALLFAGKWAYQQHSIHRTKQVIVKQEQSLALGNFQQALVYENKLKHNVLYPYLVYNDLVARLNQLPIAEVNLFLSTYANTPLAEKLRKQWLTTLAKKQQWLTFLQFYQSSADQGQQCLYATALLKTGQVTQAYDLAENLWMVAYSQSPNCNDLFSAWVGAQQLTPDMVWQRFEMAIAADQLSLATYLRGLLSPEQQTYAQAWLAVRANPKLILNTQIFIPEDNKPNDLLIYGIQRLALSDADAAAKAWQDLRVSHHFTAVQAQLAIQAVAMGYIKGDHAQANIWLQQLEPAYLSTTAKNWRLLFALQQKNWPLLMEWIEQMTPFDRNDPQWQYWYARALEETGQPKQAGVIYAQLISQRGYYSFLAASRLGVPINIKNEILPISKAEIQAVVDNPGIERMRALYDIKQKDLASAEWWFAITNMTPKQRYVAAKLALQWKLYPLALATTSYLSEQNDLNLRYPSPYSRQIEKEAARLKVDPAFVYAIMRQESLFNPQAASGVGAQGLMQLMPTTAAMLLKQNKLPADNVNKLTTPAVNIQLGIIYLGQLLTNNQHNPALAAAAYNAGPHRVKQWLPVGGNLDLDIWVDSIPYPETRTYVKHVLTYMVIYQSLLKNQSTMPVSFQDVENRTNS